MADREIILIDDARGVFGPWTDMRTCAQARTGWMSSWQRIEHALSAQVTCVHVHACHRPFVQRQAAFDGVDGGFIAMRGGWKTWLDRGGLDATPGENDMVTDARALIARPWHVLDHLEAALLYDLACTAVPRCERLPVGVSAVGDHPVHIPPDATVLPGVVFDTRRGPIVIHQGATLGANAVLEGPCSVGVASTAVARAYIRANTVVGDDCKVGGEISFSIIDDYSNKAHDGYLGHAIVGQWGNLGADTNVSNLKNTYGPVRVQLQSDLPPEDTGRTFLGPLIGDFVRTGIGARLTTGCVVGTGAMFARTDFAPRHISAFSFHTDRGVEPYDVEKLLETVRVMMARRDRELPDVVGNRLRALASQGESPSLRVVGG